MRLALALCLMLAAAGCVVAPTFTPAAKVASDEPVNLSKVYIYSFLDVRSRELGPTMMSEIEKQLGEALKARSVEAQQHWFQRDPIAVEMARTGGSERVPVGDVISHNVEAEGAFGARYRLIAFPTQTTSAGAWFHYDFRWTLYDTQASKVIWETTSQGKHMNWASADESPVDRARVIVDGLMAQMASAGLVTGATVQSLDVARQLEELEQLRSTRKITNEQYQRRRKQLEATAKATEAAAKAAPAAPTAPAAAPEAAPAN